MGHKRGKSGSKFAKCRKFNESPPASYTAREKAVVNMTQKDIDSQCTTKRRYHCKALAKKVLGKQPKEHIVKRNLGVYYCNICFGWHIGRSNRSASTGEYI
jgi:hypothetical protein